MLVLTFIALTVLFGGVTQGAECLLMQNNGLVAESRDCKDGFIANSVLSFSS